MLSMADAIGNSGGVGSELHNEIYTVVGMCSFSASFAIDYLTSIDYVQRGRIHHVYRLSHHLP